MEKNTELENSEFEQFITERLASDIELLDENGVGKLMGELERNHYDFPDGKPTISIVG